MSRLLVVPPVTHTAPRPRRHARCLPPLWWCHWRSETRTCSARRYWAAYCDSILCVLLLRLMLRLVSVWSEGEHCMRASSLAGRAGAIATAADTDAARRDLWELTMEQTEIDGDAQTLTSSSRCWRRRVLILYTVYTLVYLTGLLRY